MYIYIYVYIYIYISLSLSIAIPKVQRSWRRAGGPAKGSHTFDMAEETGKVRTAHRILQILYYNDPMEEVVDWNSGFEGEEQSQSLLCGSHLPAEHGSGSSPGPRALLVTHVVEDEPWTDEPWTCSLLAARERRTATCDSRLWSLALSFHSKFRARCRHFSCWSTKTLSTLEHLSSTAAEWSASCRTWSLRSSTNLLIIPFQESLAACGIVAGKSFANASASEFCKGTGGATTTGDRSGLLTVLMSSTFCPHLSDRNNVKAMTKFSFTSDICSRDAVLMA